MLLYILHLRVTYFSKYGFYSFPVEDLERQFPSNSWKSWIASVRIITCLRVPSLSLSLLALQVLYLPLKRSLVASNVPSPVGGAPRFPNYEHLHHLLSLPLRTIPISVALVVFIPRPFDDRPLTLRPRCRSPAWSLASPSVPKYTMIWL